MDPSIQIVQQKLQQGPTLPNRTNISIPDIITLLEFCLKNIYFLFQGKYYKQVHGAAIGSPISPLIANLFMEEFEVKALALLHTPPVSGLGLLMTFMSSKRQNTANYFYSTSTHRTLTDSSQWMNPTKMDHVHSWTPKFHQAPTTPSSPHFTGNQHIQTNIYTGTVSTSWGLNTVFTIHWHTGPK